VPRNRGPVLDKVLGSDEPSIRWKAVVRIAGEAPDSAKAKDLREEIRNSTRAKTLLGGRELHFVREADVEAEYRGAQWTPAALAEIGYPGRRRTAVPDARSSP
jgi:hypothetical protein